MPSTESKPNKGLIILIIVTAIVVAVAAGVLTWFLSTQGHTPSAHTPAAAHLPGSEYPPPAADIEPSYDPYPGNSYPEDYHTPDYHTQEPEPTILLSPSDLQLAMFAHMAFFPFDINTQELPLSHSYNPMHYEPFFTYVIPADDTGKNHYGFNFTHEMAGWHMARSYHNRDTGFRVLVYSCEYGNTIVLSFRGSDGHIGQSILTQTGTWWCNFRTVAGYPHSHKESLAGFLHLPETVAMLQNANIYITGHSLGGYLAYIAAYRLVQMGLEENIQRVAAFSAPIFTPQTLELVSALSPQTRSRMVHYYVPEDLIAGLVGVDMGAEFPGYGAFELINRMIGALRNVRGFDVPIILYTSSGVMATVEDFLPFGVPEHITEMLWRLDSVVGEEALAITNQFRTIIPHVQVPQTWHSDRPDPPWNVDASPLAILLGYTEDLVVEIVLDIVMRIFDTDSHFMMNFYSYLRT